MIGNKTQVDVSGAVKKLERLGIVFDKFELLNAIGSRHLKWINDNFEQEGRLQPSGGWPTLSENTIANRRLGSSRILQDRGRLKQSYYKKIIGDHAVWVGSNEKTAEWHQNGTSKYIIKPKTKKALKFRTAKGSIVRKQIQHPGLKKRPMLPTKVIGKKLGITIIEARIRDSGVTK